jgi:NAD-dependent deacetylase
MGNTYFLEDWLGRPLSGKPLVVALTGAGISAESGIPTFRDANGLWHNHNIMEVASIEGWHKNPALVLEFYNQRRAGAHTCQPISNLKLILR